MENIFGPHVMIDIKQCDKLAISNRELIFDILNELPELMGMTKIAPPYVFPYNGLVPEDKGITGVVIIAESHLTIHTFTEKDYVFVDMFSCKNFDTKRAIDYIIKKFESKSHKVRVVERGLDFPR